MLLPMSHPDVVTAKRAYEKGLYHRKCVLSFDELYRAFQNPKNSFSKIAEKARVSKQVISQKYRIYFSALASDDVKDGIKRAKKAAAGTKRYKKTLIRDNSPSAILARLLRKKGMPFSRVIGSDTSGNPLKHFLRVNKKLCYVITSSKARKFKEATKYKYFSFRVNKKSIRKAKIICMLAMKDKTLETYIFKVSDLNLPKDDRRVFYVPNSNGRWRKKRTENYRGWAFEPLSALNRFELFH